MRMGENVAMVTPFGTETLGPTMKNALLRGSAALERLGTRSLRRHYPDQVRTVGDAPRSARGSNDWPPSQPGCPQLPCQHAMQLYPKGSNCTERCQRRSALLIAGSAFGPGLGADQRHEAALAQLLVGQPAVLASDTIEHLLRLRANGNDEPPA